MKHEADLGRGIPCCLMNFLRLMSLLAAVQVGGISSGHAASLEPQVMRDWTVRCHDSRYCIAETPGSALMPISARMANAEAIMSQLM